jgi:hypothetical protein
MSNGHNLATNKTKEKFQGSLLTLLMEGAMFFTQQKSDHNAKL